MNDQPTIFYLQDHLRSNKQIRIALATWSYLDTGASRLCWYAAVTAHNKPHTTKLYYGLLFKKN